MKTFRIMKGFDNLPSDTLSPRRPHCEREQVGYQRSEARSLSHARQAPRGGGVDQWKTHCRTLHSKRAEVQTPPASRAQEQCVRIRTRKSDITGTRTLKIL